jgi:PcfJ-like protein
MSRPGWSPSTVLRDVLSAFVGQVVLPSLVLDDWEKQVIQDPEAALEELFRPASSLLFGAASLNGVIERTIDWHRMRGAIDHGIDRLTPERRDLHVWPAGMPELSFDNGKTVVRPLTSRRDLIAEGRPALDADGIAGLDHCVGGFGYVGRCLAGKSRILSIRSVAADGVETRMSTAEVSISLSEPHFKVRQHCGLKNTAPSESASRALDAYLAELRATTLDWSPFKEIKPQATTLSDIAHYDTTIPDNVEKCLRLWDPLLPKTLRGLTIGAFGDLARTAIAATHEADPE